MARLFASAKFFEQLPAVQARHFIVAKNGVGKFVNDFQQRIAAIVCQHDFAVRLKPLLNQIAYQRIILRHQQLNRFCALRRHARFAERALPFRPF